MWQDQEEIFLKSKGESEDEGRWKLHLISSGSWKLISVKIWNSRSGIFLSSEYAISK